VKKSRTVSASAGTGQDEPSATAILVIGEDAVCSLHARAVMARVNRLLPQDMPAKVTVREFEEVIASGPTRADKSGRPNMVMVSVRGNQPLPPQVRQWLSGWAKGTRGAARAMTAVFDRRYQSSPILLETWSYLQELASQTGIDWIEAGGSMLPPSDAFRNDLVRQATTVSSTLDSIIRTPRPPSRPASDQG
jgi:hypothetical protein